jgi:hypothetical protein
MRRREFIERGTVSQRRPNVLPAMRVFCRRDESLLHYPFEAL